MNSFEKFISIYKTDPLYSSFCPYRVCPLGAHVDHQLGKVTGFAIDKGINISYSPIEDGTVELTSLQFENPVSFSIYSVPAIKAGDWADHIRGAVKALSSRYELHCGLRGVIEGSLPIGGLSSSASVIISFLKSLCFVNDISLSDQELIAISLDAEFNYVGVTCGKLDQSCEVLCRKNRLLYLDTKDDSYSLAEPGNNMRSFSVALFFSGLERSLVNSKYNLRVDECKSAAYYLTAKSGMEYDKYNSAVLRNVPYDVFEKYSSGLPDEWKKRAEHFYGENARVEKGAEFWKKGDIESFGKLIFESGNSSIYNYEAGCDELKCLHNILLKTDGVYGGRFSGAGFKGCYMSLIDPAYENEILSSVKERYLKEFPALADKYSACICSTADGVGIGEVK